jgi:hypothetical protein
MPRQRYPKQAVVRERGTHFKAVRKDDYTSHDYLQITFVDSVEIRTRRVVLTRLIRCLLRFAIC